MSNELTRLYKALQYSCAGLRAAFHHQAAFRLEVIVCLIAMPLAMHLGATALQRIALISSLFLILIVELFNSAIEAAVDRVGYEHHVLSGRAKDVASAAVFMAVLNALVVWAIVLI